MIDPIRIEHALSNTLSTSTLDGSPERLSCALRYAVFPGGARVRPRLLAAVALANGDDRPALTDAAATAIELLHCASLVHDDLPCFDDANLRRGKPSLHVAFGEPLAVLTGDALIVMAFQVLGRACTAAPDRLAALLAIIGAGVGAPHGIVAGQAWECEDDIPLSRYQQEKTGALFAAATMAGAAAAGVEAEPWRRLGQCIGEAYQVADDLLDANGDARTVGKPVGQDRHNDRPSAVREMGQRASAKRLSDLVEEALGSIPACPGEAALRELIARESEQFVKLALRCRAAA
ncbi:MAG: polyprenyl synthetase family protein [Pseudomonadota bacterium]